MSILIAIKGEARHGKDTVGALLKDCGFESIAFAETLKASAVALDCYVQVDRLLFFHQTKIHPTNIEYEEFMQLSRLLSAVGGMDEAKRHPDVRRLLQRLGTEVGRNIIGPAVGLESNLWLVATSKKLDDYRTRGINVVVTDLRYPNEGEFIKAHGGYIWDVYRPNFNNGLAMRHSSESNFANIPHDLQLVNNGDAKTFLAVLSEQVKKGLAAING